MDDQNNHLTKEALSVEDGATSTDVRVPTEGKTLLDVANGNPSEETTRLVWQMMDLICNKRGDDFENQMKLMEGALFIMCEVPSKMQRGTAAQRNTALSVKNGIPILRAAAQTLQRRNRKIIQAHKTSKRTKANATRRVANVMGTAAATLTILGSQKGHATSPPQPPADMEAKKKK